MPIHIFDIFNIFDIFEISSGSSGEPLLPVFQVNVPNQSTGFMDDVAIGVGGLTELRDGSLWAEDYQGIYQEFGPGEVARSGGRVTGAVGARQVSWKDENGDPFPQLPRIVHAPEATNNRTHSADLDNNDWIKRATSVTEAGIDALIEGKKVWKLVENGDDIVHAVEQTASETAETQSIVIYARQAERSVLQICSYVSSQLYANFDLATGSITQTGPFVEDGDAAITSEGNEWYKCALTGVYGSGSRILNIITTDPNAGWNPSHQGDGVSGMYFASIESYPGINAALAVTLPPTPTGATPETRPTCALSFDAANHDDAEGTYLIDVDLSGDSNILDGFLSVVNGLATLTDGINTTVAPKLHPEKMGFVYGPDGLRVTADGVSSALVPYDGTLLSGELDLFRAAAVAQEAGELNRYAVSDQSIVDGEMPAPPTYSGITLVVKTTTDNETFILPCFNTGTYNATIDWGDGTADSTITTWDDGDLEHEYSEPGVHEVTITGVLPRIYFNNTGDKDKVVGLLSAKIVGTDYSSSFYGCSISVIPSQIINLTITSFSSCFYDNNLTSIPEGLFDNTPSVASFRYCFTNNNLTSIPDGLFDNTPGVTNFALCFYDNSLTAIPDGLFDNTPGVTNFSYCFSGNASLSTVPAGIFDNCTVATNYASCFTGCNLTEQSTNNVLVSLDTAGASNGTVDITGQQPTGAGAAAKTSLESKGWTVTVTTP